MTINTSDPNTFYSKAKKFIDKYWKEHGYSPSIAEIRGAVGANSNSTIVNVLGRMRAEGVILDTTADGKNGSHAFSRKIVPTWIYKKITEA